MKAIIGNVDMCGSKQRGKIMRFVTNHADSAAVSILGLILLLVPAARADTATVQINASGLPAYTSTVNNEYVYVGPAQGTLTITGQQPQPIVLWCDDFGHTTYVPTSYLV